MANYDDDLRNNNILSVGTGCFVNTETAYATSAKSSELDKTVINSFLDNIMSHNILIIIRVHIIICPYPGNGFITSDRIVFSRIHYDNISRDCACL